MRAGALELTWQGERGQTLRAILGVSGGQPVVRELAVRRNGEWSVLGRDLTPEYQVTTGRRRISAQQEVPLRQLGMFTPEIIDRQKWFTFWDAPLNVPGRPGSNAAVDLPRKTEEIQRAWATFQVTGCRVSTDGARLEANLPGVSLGIFSGSLRYTVYRGANLIRQEVIAKTEAPSVTYKFVAGLKGFTIGNDAPLGWRGGPPPLAAQPLRRPRQQRPRGVEGAQPAGDHRKRRRYGGRLPRIPQILLFARSGSQPRVQLLPQGQRDHFCGRSTPGRSRGILQTLRHDRRRLAAPRHPGSRV